MTSMSFFTIVKANYIIMLAIYNCMSLLTTTVTPLHITIIIVTLMTFFSTSETNNLNRSISFLGTTLVIQTLLTLISRSAVRLTTTLLLLTLPLIDNLVMSFGVFVIDFAATHQIRKLSDLLVSCCLLDLITQTIHELDALREFNILSSIVWIKLGQLNKLSSILCYWHITLL